MIWEVLEASQPLGARALRFEELLAGGRPNLLVEAMDTVVVARLLPPQALLCSWTKANNLSRASSRCDGVLTQTYYTYFYGHRGTRFCQTRIHDYVLVEGVISECLRQVNTAAQSPS